MGTSNNYGKECDHNWYPDVEYNDEPDIGLTEWAQGMVCDKCGLYRAYEFCNSTEKMQLDAKLSRINRSDFMREHGDFSTVKVYHGIDMESSGDDYMSDTPIRMGHYYMRCPIQRLLKAYKYHPGLRMVLKNRHERAMIGYFTLKSYLDERQRRSVRDLIFVVIPNALMFGSVKHSMRPIFAIGQKTRVKYV